MSVQANGKAPLDRTRLCQLAKVPRGKHIRWTKDGLLIAKREYGELDLIRAAILDELTHVVKPSLAKATWLQVEKDLDTLTPRLQVMVSITTKRAQIIQDGTQLDRLLPRNEPVIVVELAERVEEARSRLREFRGTTTQPAWAQQPPDAATVLRLESSA